MLVLVLSEAVLAIEAWVHRPAILVATSGVEYEYEYEHEHEHERLASGTASPAHAGWFCG